MEILGNRRLQIQQRPGLGVCIEPGIDLIPSDFSKRLIFCTNIPTTGGSSFLKNWHWLCLTKSEVVLLLLRLHITCCRVVVGCCQHSHSAPDKLRNRISVNTLEFLLFLFLQQFGSVSLRSNAAHDVEWPVARSLEEEVGNACKWQALCVFCCTVTCDVTSSLDQCAHRSDQIQIQIHSRFSVLRRCRSLPACREPAKPVSYSKCRRYASSVGRPWYDSSSVQRDSNSNRGIMHPLHQCKSLRCPSLLSLSSVAVAVSAPIHSIIDLFALPFMSCYARYRLSLAPSCSLFP